MEEVAVEFEFPEHVPDATIANLISGISACGNVLPGDRDRSYVVSAVRAAKLPKLKMLMEHNERFGFIRWSKTR